MLNTTITKKRYYLVIQDINHPFMVLSKGQVLDYDTDTSSIYFHNERTAEGGSFNITTILKHSDFFKEISKEKAQSLREKNK